MKKVTSLKEYKDQKNEKLQKEFDELERDLDFRAVMRHQSGLEINYEAMEKARRAYEEIRVPREFHEEIRNSIKNKNK